MYSVPLTSVDYYPVLGFTLHDFSGSWDLPYWRAPPRSKVSNMNSYRLHQPRFPSVKKMNRGQELTALPQTSRQPPSFEEIDNCGSTCAKFLRSYYYDFLNRIRNVSQSFWILFICLKQGIFTKKSSAIRITRRTAF